ncbi:exonuclease domain-containing protein [Curtobacterium sp. MCBD17_040]|uniref:exonuclease domain-containing protein n=1 Tax=Curtobacterium sp. MCBD17_040 TaxID=2175674 RepID=UPI000DA70A43|nr:exonuclease domain-containing protein [Curtobacterium sp. MCBD17_040]WIB65337.1 exonuclease domain-containing protein [Curtobacterium sp. MCBD17_040]
MLISDIDKIAVFDTETTGVDVENDRIVTAFIGVMDRNLQLLERHEWLIDPGIPIPDGAAAVHGVTTEKAQADGIPAWQGVTEIVTTLQRYVDLGMPICAYNLRYDATITDREARRHGIAPLGHFHGIDPYVLDKAIDTYRRGSRKLLDTAALNGIVLENAHTADADAIAAGGLAWIFMDRARPVEGTIEALHKAQITWARQQATSLEAYFRDKKNQPDAYVEKVWPIPAIPGEVIDDELELVFT